MRVRFEKLMRKKVIIGIIMAMVIGVSAYIYIAKIKEAAYTSVKTTQVSKGEVKSYLATTAVVKSKNIKEYYGQQMRVSKLNVKVGQSVTKGQVLLSYDVTDINNSIRQAEIQYENAVISKNMLTNNNNELKNRVVEANKKIAELESQIEGLRSSTNPLDFARIYTLETQLNQLKSSKESLKPVSSDQLKQSDNAIALAEIALNSAKSKLAEGKDSIASDFDGIVTSVNVVEGGFGNPAVPAIVIQDLNNLKAVVSVGKFDASKIQLEQQAELKVNGNTVKGKVSYIDPVAKKTASISGGDTTLSTEIDILDKAEGLKVDFDTEINILLGEKNSVIKVPAEAIESDKGNRTYLYVVEGNKVIKRTVKLGLQSELEVEVTEGVSEGEKVVLNPTETLKDGSLVKENTEVNK